MLPFTYRKASVWFMYKSIKKLIPKKEKKRLAYYAFTDTQSSGKPPEQNKEPRASGKPG